MKAISKRDLLTIIPMINDREDFDIDDFELLLERFGDEWYVRDGVYQLCKENEEMKQIRSNRQVEMGGLE